MKDFYICDAPRFENQVITSSFVVASKQAKPKKSGELYLALTLSDRTGHIEAKMWDNVPDHIDLFDQDDFIKVRGLINKFNGRFQLTLHKLRSMADSEVESDGRRLHRKFSESASQGLDQGFHGRSPNRVRLQDRARRQITAPRLPGWSARSRGLALSPLRPGLPQLSGDDRPRPAACRGFPARYR